MIEFCVLRIHEDVMPPHHRGLFRSLDLNTLRSLYIDKSCSKLKSNKLARVSDQKNPSWCCKILRNLI